MESSTTSWSVEERNSFGNLLCNAHHKRIDGADERYTVEILGCSQPPPHDGDGDVGEVVSVGRKAARGRLEEG
ncbi:hypothetical protein SLNWT_6858 [Streptomyces albus]|uniref:Uncharacterized protein n=1 Tax=Streptomyces albus (strain ATCC 21838 / DSM 41398 / FERM P-419 / JCM 4703 / NBRC 107858) TaxID=1081613 RepID=A0A0B5EZI5_STRA4|nr:hypothetical protein SLNWT_6858 [Streptomyces albus]AOU81538.1 hypothetical protein SLNHY_6847 [Streptomyces albus]AYN37232.1 hypothetical protein DUI70_6739 [Streptomyces albus]